MTTVAERSSLRGTVLYKRGENWVWDPVRKTLNVLYSKCEKCTASVRGVGCRQNKEFN